jgi:hypothetical protein
MTRKFDRWDRADTCGLSDMTKLIGGFHVYVRTSKNVEFRTD